MLYNGRNKNTYLVYKIENNENMIEIIKHNKNAQWHQLILEVA